MTGKGSALLRFGKPAVNVRSFAGDDGLADGQIGFEAGVENVTDMVFGRVYAINHADEQRLSGGNSHFAALTNTSASRCGSWGRSRSGRSRSRRGHWRGAATTAGKG